MISSSYTKGINQFSDLTCKLYLVLRCHLILPHYELTSNVHAHYIYFHQNLVEEFWDTYLRGFRPFEYQYTDTESMLDEIGNDQTTDTNQVTAPNLRHNRVNKLKSIHDLHSGNKKNDSFNNNESDYVSVLS